MTPTDQRDLRSASILVDPGITDHIDWLDIATAATAVRNLNGYDIGTRQLRVDFSEKEGSGRGQSSHSDVSSTLLIKSTNAVQAKSTNLLPPLPEGKPPPVGVTIPTAISQTLQAYPPQQLTDIISQLKAVATNSPEQGNFPILRSPLTITARQLLTSSPQLAYATFQAMLMMNLVDASVLQHVVATTGQPAPPAQPAPPPTNYPPRPSVAPPTNIDPQKVSGLICFCLIVSDCTHAESNEFNGRSN